MKLTAEIIEPITESGCWIWMGPLTSGGYGNRGGGKMEAHRAFYRKHRGRIPSGMFVLHRCDVRCCVNPAHLFIGTQADNMHDMKLKGRARAPKGEAQNKAKLTNEQVLAIRTSSLSTRKLGRLYGVSGSTISYIKRQVTWSHLF